MKIKIMSVVLNSITSLLITVPWQSTWSCSETITKVVLQEPSVQTDKKKNNAFNSKRKIKNVTNVKLKSYNRENI